MPSDHPSPTGTLNFTIREGRDTAHQEIITETEKLHYRVLVNDGYDIDFSIRAKSTSSVNRGTWIFLEPSRVTNLTGFIDSSSFATDGITLPVVIEFSFDNRFSWFNSKNVYLSIKKESETTSMIPDKAEDPIVPVIFPGRLEARAKIDLQWLNHVVGEALMRCPSSTPTVLRKLEELKELLRDHVAETKPRAII